MLMRRHNKTLLTVALLFIFLFSLSGQALAQATCSDIVKEALKYEGRPVFTNSVAYIQQVYKRVGISLPSTLDSISRKGTRIRIGEQLQLGDIVLFGHSSTNLTSAGIFAGNNRFIISWQPYGTIRVVSLSSPDAAPYYLGARRIVPFETIRDRVIHEGLKYLGTPYEFNSDRSSTATFDCSDFVRRTYFDATGTWIPGNSRTQAAYVRENGKTTRNWSNLKRGDLMFFTNSSGTINHVAIYMENNQILHATSSRGVHVGTMNSYWINCFSFGGNILD